MAPSRIDIIKIVHVIRHKYVNDYLKVRHTKSSTYYKFTCRYM